MEEIFIGVDVSMDWLDIHHPCHDHRRGAQQIANGGRERTAFARRAARAGGGTRPASLVLHRRLPPLAIRLIEPQGDGGEGQPAAMEKNAGENDLIPRNRSDRRSIESILQTDHRQRVNGDLAIIGDGLDRENPNIVLS